MGREAHHTNALLAKELDRVGRDCVVSSGFGNSPATAIRAWAWSRLTSRITQWRNWKLVIKLTAVVLVPVIFAVTLGVLQIRDQIQHADEYSRLDSIVGASGSVRSAVAELQGERTRVAEFLVDGPTSVANVRQRFAGVDRALAGTRSALRDQFSADSAGQLARSEVDRQVDRLPELRREVLGTQVDPVFAVNTYTRVIGALLAVDRTLTGRISSAELNPTATTLHELARVGEEMRLQQALVLVGLLRGTFSPESRAQLGDSETRRLTALNEFRAAATQQQRQDYEDLYATPDFAARENAVHLALTSREASTPVSWPSPLTASGRAWETHSQDALNAVGALQTRMDQDLHQRAFALRDDASNMAGLESVILLSALLIAGAIVVVIARHLLGSLDLLRRSALDIANTQLPRTVADIRAGSRAMVARVPINTSEEVGQVARAFDAVHAQATNLASEQAELRKSYGDSFVNVSRRSQSLLERQLRLFEHLERDEEDPDQLATLFQLDHLATRMRRNNENLMVLAGSDFARRFNQPTTPADLLRAAVSEIEHYPRVVVQPVPDAKVIGYAASDLVRLLAELLDNAANFSPPQTNVTVSGYRRGDGSLGIDIIDRGIGMAQDELAAANERLTTDGEAELSTSRRMGLFVAGRLAARHGIEVELHPGPDDTGVRASVTLRAELLLDAGGSRVGSGANGASHVAARHVLPHSGGESGAAEPGAVGPSRNGFHLLASEASAAPFDAGHESHVPEEPSCARESSRRFSSAGQPREGTARGEDDREAPTPIFDDLASAWFRVSQSPSRAYQHPDDGGVQWPARPASDASKGTFRSHVAGRFPYSHQQHGEEASSPRESQSHAAGEANRINGRPTPDRSAPDRTGEWNFTNDHARRHAEQVSAAEPEDYTAVGLPRRTPQAHLIAGSADASASAGTPRPQRDPNVARGRLSSFQRGLWQGRHNTSNGYSQERSLTAEAFTAENDSAPGDEQWLNPDSAAQQAETAVINQHVDRTAAGLPRRTPRAQLRPGALREPASDISPQRNADLVRGRLAGFQRGMREGKHTLRDPERADDHF
jgi:signal transduction histidine kinase